MKRYLLYGHGGSYNHGAEAITRCTINALRKTSPNSKITLSTHFPEQDREFSLPFDQIVERNTEGNSWEEIYASAIESITPETVCIHVGGDNYCYKNWQRYAAIHYKALERGAKSILWSCSLEPEMIDSEMISALSTHHLICARETVTYNALIECGLTNIVKVADIAFRLEPEKTDFDIKNYAVLNLSPLVVRKNSLALNAFKRLIEHILTETDLNVALVPHVVMPVDNDYDILRELNAGYERTTLVSDKLSAAQYKYIISNARFCVAARTHACIAAYSSCVPVLALGYSSKSIGIARDLGMENYVVNTLGINDDEYLVSRFKLLQNGESNIKNHLTSVIPGYIAGAVINKIL